MIFLLRTRHKCRPARQRNCHAGTLSCYLQSFRDFQRICVWNKGNGYFRTFIRFDVKTWNSLFSCTFLKSFLVIGSFLTRFKHPEALMPRLTNRNTGFDVSWTSSTSVITIDKIDIANMNRKKIVFSIARDTQQTTPIISYFLNYSQSFFTARWTRILNRIVATGTFESIVYREAVQIDLNLQKDNLHQAANDSLDNIGSQNFRLTANFSWLFMGRPKFLKHNFQF